jgi:hypothetical protein
MRLPLVNVSEGLKESIVAAMNKLV